MDPNATPVNYPQGPGSPAYYGQPGAGTPQSTTVSTGDWVVTILLSAIPLVNFVLLFVWAFSSGTAPSKANWAKATLIFLLIFSVLGFLFAGTFMAMVMKAGGAGRGN